MKPLKSNEEKLLEKNELFYEKILLFAVQSSILERVDGASIASAGKFMRNHFVDE
jgi:hypothetical protein